MGVRLFSVPGETGYNFLKLDTGNRAIGMGGAYAGVAGDITAIMYNPAGLYKIKGQELYFIYRRWIAGTDYSYLSYSRDIKRTVSLAATLIYFGMPDVREVDSMGVETGDTLTGSGYAVILTGSREVFAGILAGLNIKWVREDVVETRSSSLILDVGLLKELYRTPSDGVTVGLTLQNWNMRFQTDPEDPVPVNIKLGMEYQAYENFKANLDINKPVERDFRYNIGAEYKFMNLVSIRCGYKIGYDLENLCFGIGVNGERFYSKIRFEVDYAYTSLGLLEQSQNISLKIKF